MDTIDASQVKHLERALNMPSIMANKPRPKYFVTLSFALRTVPVLVCFLLLIVTGVSYWPRYAADYRTATGEMKTVILEDGTSVVLNTDSYFSIDFSQDRRVISMRGEAYFQVAPEPDRPFDVVTEVGKVRALGTAFDVKALDENMEVTVFQHAVQVEFDPVNSKERINEGERVTFENGQTKLVAQVDLTQVGKWRERKLMFVDQTLEGVITELNRYRPGQIVILNGRLAKHRVTGVFDSDSTDEALHAIETTLNIKQYRITDQFILLTR